MAIIVRARSSGCIPEALDKFRAHDGDRGHAGAGVFARQGNDEWGSTLDFEDDLIVATGDIFSDGRAGDFLIVLPDRGEAVGGCQLNDFVAEDGDRLLCCCARIAVIIERGGRVFAGSVCGRLRRKGSSCC